MTPVSQKPSPFDRISSGIEGLDVILNGGFVVGGMYIIQGVPGAGKTILTNQICFQHIATGGVALFVTLLAENHARLMGNLRVLDFFDESAIPDKLAYLSAFNEVRTGGLKALVDLVRREVLKRGATLLVIDGIVSAEASAKSDQAFREMIHEMQEIAIAAECTIFLTTGEKNDASPERTMVDGLIELSERRFGWQAQTDLQVTKFRGSAFLRGRHSYKISNAGITLYPRIEALLAYPSQSIEASNVVVSTGVSNLDLMLGGGVTTGSVTLLAGPAGIGKTTMGLQFLAQCSEESPGLWFGLYETPERARSRIDDMPSGLGKLIDSELVNLVWQPAASDLLDAHGARLLQTVREKGIKRVVIDGLNAFFNGTIDHSRISDFFGAISNEFRALGVTAIYVAETEDVFGVSPRLPVQNTSLLADNVVMLRFVERHAQLHRLISILKTRGKAFDPHSREFTISQNGVEVSDSPDSAVSLSRLLGWQSAGDVYGNNDARAQSLSPGV